MKYWILALVFVFAGLGEWAFVTWAPLTPELRRYKFTHLPGIKQYREAVRQKKFDKAFEIGDKHTLIQAMMTANTLGDNTLKTRVKRRVEGMDTAFSRYVLYYLEHGSSTVYPPEKELVELIHQMSLEFERPEKWDDEKWIQTRLEIREIFEDLRQKADEGDDDSVWIMERLIFPEQYWTDQESVSSG